MIDKTIAMLLQYARRTELLAQEDAIYARNRMLSLLDYPSYEWKLGVAKEAPLEEILDSLCDYAVRQGLIADTQHNREQFETALMDTVTPPPSVVQAAFRSAYAYSPRRATDYFYALNEHSNYIRTYRTKRDRRWKVRTEYGALDLTINLAKPERDPRDIAAAREIPQSGYPTCQLCADNEGYAGRMDYPARHTLRIVPVELCGEEWGLQYSPYLYYNEHCIVLNKLHAPMRITAATFQRLLAFVEQFPHYFIGSNADLPYVGGSILSHDHFQGGRYTFALEQAPVNRAYTVRGFEDISIGIVHWPMSTLRISHPNKDRLAALASELLAAWLEYSDESVDILASSAGERHNALTPIARMRGASFELDIVLRNNRTTPAHPKGLFHAHAEVHNIKHENIGLIEALGLAVLPARLDREMAFVREALLSRENLRSNAETAKHADWVDAWIHNYTVTKDNIDAILMKEMGKSFAAGLGHAGVFKQDDNGKEAFGRFLASIGGREIKSAMR